MNEDAAFEVHISGYKSIADTTCELANGLNVFIGPNGAGKTCLLSAFAFVRNILQHGVAQAVAMEGGSRRVYHRGRSILQLTIRQSYGTRVIRHRRRRCLLSWSLSIADRGREPLPTIIRESVRITTMGVPEISIVEFAIDRSKRKPTSALLISRGRTFERDLFDRWKYGQRFKRPTLIKHLRRHWSAIDKHAVPASDLLFLPRLADLDTHIAQLGMRLMNVTEYNINPEAARAAAAPLPEVRMSRDGTGLGAVIYALKGDRPFTETSGDYPRLMFDTYGRPLYRSKMAGYWFDARRHAKRERPSDCLVRINVELAEAVASLETVSADTDRNSGRRVLVFRSNRITFDPMEVSDGTIKWLSLLVSIVAGNAPVYLIEEPENFVHPWMQQRLMQLMRERAARDGAVFIIASHSVTLLNAALPRETKIVTSDARGTHVHAIADRGDMDSLLQESSFRLGDLWVSGGIGGVPA